MAKAETKRSTKSNRNSPTVDHVQRWIKLHRLDITIGLESSNGEGRFYLTREMNDDAQEAAIEAFHQFRRRDPAGVDSVLRHEITEGRDCFMRCYFKEPTRCAWALQPPVKR